MVTYEKLMRNIVLTGKDLLAVMAKELEYESIEAFKESSIWEAYCYFIKHGILKYGNINFNCAVLKELKHKAGFGLLVKR